MIGTQVNEALQSIAHAIKGCHRSILFENAKSRGPMSGFRVYIGPPTNVVWDVIANTSVRSLYTGFVQFTVPRAGWVPDDVYNKWSDRASDHYKTLLFEYTQT